MLHYNFNLLILKRALSTYWLQVSVCIAFLMDTCNSSYNLSKENTSLVFWKSVLGYNVVKQFSSRTVLKHRKLCKHRDVVKDTKYWTYLTAPQHLKINMYVNQMIAITQLFSRNLSQPPEFAVILGENLVNTVAVSRKPCIMHWKLKIYSGQAIFEVHIFDVDETHSEVIKKNIFAFVILFLASVNNILFVAWCYNILWITFFGWTNMAALTSIVIFFRIFMSISNI